MSVQGWETIKVFISSTFRDMHSEREQLVKVVFPRLRERLEPYRLHIDDIDLRWGITEKQARDKKTLDLCLQWVDECRPFFLGVLGERYGFSDTPNQQSMTEYEIRRRLQHHTPVPAVLCERNPAVVDELPLEARRVLSDDYESCDEKQKKALQNKRKALREWVIHHQPNGTLYRYDCDYAGWHVRDWVRRKLSRSTLNILDRYLGPDGFLSREGFASLDAETRQEVIRQGILHLQGLEGFSSWVYDQLWEAIRTAKQLPEAPRGRLHPVSVSSAQQDDEAFIMSRLRHYVPRIKIEEDIHAYMQSQASVPCLVTGLPGTGKSTALSHFVKTCSNTYRNLKVVTHFVGASPGSTDPNEMWRHLLQQLGVDAGQMDETEPKYVFFKALADFNGPVVVVIDAVDQLDDGSDKIGWLPHTLAPGCKLILSCALAPSQSRLLWELLEQRDLIRVEVDVLTKSERQDIIASVPTVFAKTLEPAYIDALLQNEATANPLFLLVVLEELRILAPMEQLAGRIDALPAPRENTLTELFFQVLERLEQDFGYACVKRVLAWMASARFGLSVTELEALNRQDEAHAEPSEEAMRASPDRLHDLLRQLRFYLLLRGSLMNFFHNNFRFAIQERYLDQDENKAFHHRQLATYFHALVDAERGGISGDPRGLAELPFQLAQGGQDTALLALLTNYEFLEAKLNVAGPADLISDYEQLPHVPAAGLSHVVADALTDIAERLRRRQHVLELKPQELAGQLWGLFADDTRPPVYRLLMGAQAGSSWLKPLMATLAPLSPLIAEISKQGSRASAFALVSPSPAQHLIAIGEWSPGESNKGEVVRVVHLEEARASAPLAAHRTFIKAVALSADGSVVASVCNHELKAYRVATGEMIDDQRCPRDLRELVLSYDGRYAIAISGRDTVYVWEFRSEQHWQFDAGQYQDIKAVGMHPSANCVFAVTRAAIKTWNLQSDESSFIRLFPYIVRCVAVSSDHMTAVMHLSNPEEDRLALWHVGSREPLFLKVPCPNDLEHLAIGPEGDHLALVTADGHIRVYTMADCLAGQTEALTRDVAPAIVLPESPKQIALCREGKRVISRTNRIQVWDMLRQDGDAVSELHAGRIDHLHLIPGQGLVVSVSEDGAQVVWDLYAQQVVSVYDAQKGRINALCVLPDGCHMLSASGRDIHMWSLAEGRNVCILKGHQDLVSSVVTNQEGTQAISASWDHTVGLWDLPQGTLEAVFRGHSDKVTCLERAYRDSSIILSGCADGTLRLWHLVAKRSIAMFNTSSIGMDSLARIGDGPLVALMGRDQRLEIRDLSTLNVVNAFQAHIYSVTKMAVTPDGSKIITSSGDRSVCVREASSGNEIYRVRCDHSVTDLAIDQSSKQLVLVTRGGEVILHNLAEHTTEARLTLDPELGACVLDADTGTVVVGDRAGRVHFLGLEKASETYKIRE